MKYNQQPVSDISINQVIGDQATIPFDRDPQAFLRRAIGKAGNTRPGGMLIGADEIIRQIQENPEILRGR